MRNRTNKIWGIPFEKLRRIVIESNSLSDILRHLNLSSASANYRSLKKRLNEDKIDFSHIRLGINSNKGRKFPSKAIPLSEVMTENSTYSRGTLKKRLIKEGILENDCAICGQKSWWKNKELVMVIDHINGEGNDHRLENLRLLCPNCNSQTPTFSGRRLKNHYYCEDCGEERKRRLSKLCPTCSAKRTRRVKDRPSNEKLLKEIEKTNYCVVGKKYGVSDNAIRKWLK